MLDGARRCATTRACGGARPPATNAAARARRPHTPPRSKIIREGDEAEVRAALGSIERECGAALQGLPLHEPLFQLLCHGVPTSVKAAIDEVRLGRVL